MYVLSNSDWREIQTYLDRLIDATGAKESTRRANLERRVILLKKKITKQSKN